MLCVHFMPIAWYNGRKGHKTYPFYVHWRAFMRVGVIGSRGLRVDNLADYLPQETTMIVSGGAKGIDSCAKEYALANNIPITEFLPEYEKYGKIAPLKRNIEIIQHSDFMLIIWDRKSRGTKHVIDNCNKLNVPSRVILMPLHSEE